VTLTYTCSSHSMFQNSWPFSVAGVVPKKRSRPEYFCLFRNIIIFYGEELLAPRPTPKLEDNPLSVVRDCLFNVFAATFRTWRPFLHPKPEDAPCRGDRDPHNTGTAFFTFKYSCNTEEKPQVLHRSIFFYAFPSEELLG
jgi:hypothetical protein